MLDKKLYLDTYVLLNSKEFLSKCFFVREKFFDLIEHVIHSFHQPLLELIQFRFGSLLVEITLHLWQSFLDFLCKLVMVHA